MKKIETLERIKQYLDNYECSYEQLEKIENVKEYINYLIKKANI